MNEALSLAALNVSLLEAIKAGPVDGPSELAERAGIVPNHVQRKLGSLIENGLVGKTGERSTDVALTAAGEHALATMAFWAEDATAATAGDGGAYIPFDLIDPWAGNPRTWFDPASIEDMAQSIADKGVQQPITVREVGGRYQVYMGERRRRGARLAVERGWVPADFRVPCLVREVDEVEAVELAGIENIQRDDLHWMDLARYFLKLMNPPFARSGPQLERLFGRKYSARKVQDYAKIARELPAADQARAYLPEWLDAEHTKKNPDCLTYVQARGMVGDKKEKPALDLTPKLALTLLELVHAATPDGVLPTTGSVAATLYAAPTGGPLGTLSERGLVELRFDRAGYQSGHRATDMVARVALTLDIQTWLRQVGFGADRAAALFKARADVLGGELHAAARPPGRFVTDQLNPPAPRASEGEPAEGPVEGPEDFPDGDGAQAGALFGEPEGEAPRQADEVPDGAPDEDIPDYLRRLAGGGSSPPPPALSVPPAPQPVPAPKAEPEAPALPAMLAIVLVELAHRIGVEGIERGPETWAVPVLAGWQDDKRTGLLIRDHRMIAMMAQGERTLACLTRRGLDWLLSNARAIVVLGRAQMTFPVLEDQQVRLAGSTPSGRTYHTPWLNPVPPPEGEVSPQATEGASTPVGAAAGHASPAGEDGAVREAVSGAAPAEPMYEGAIPPAVLALIAVDGAARQLAEFVDRLPSQAKTPKREEVARYVEMVDRARDAAKRFLPADEAGTPQPEWVNTINAFVDDAVAFLARDRGPTSEPPEKQAAGPPEDLAWNLASAARCGAFSNALLYAAHLSHKLRGHDNPMALTAAAFDDFAAFKDRDGGLGSAALLTLRVGDVVEGQTGTRYRLLGQAAEGLEAQTLRKDGTNGPRKTLSLADIVKVRS
ncbi:ParB/RepB/Spo0J family partition protein [Phenylobacterium sp.]|uniref:ParB/RepB/Spo0J family partition protein n=1 Tax=Phenylobacterium sp. TaxID=1871053 RepID=UPI0025DC94DC|nr:ParB/RepB/Spo0J family partition protein [Phenylobacterium sp.]MBX3482505.1 ParB/RepB/Spo0J family partition protein [Phenylobacterium sp.]